MGDLTGPRLGVEALGVPPLAILERGVAEHLDEIEAGVGVHPTGQVAMLFQWADRRNQNGVAGIGDQRRDVRQPAQVLGAVGHGKAQVGVQAVAQIVAVENISGNALFEQFLLDQHRHRRLARTRKAGKPQGAAPRRPILGGHQ